MIITLKNADFSQSNIGTLSTWRITRLLGTGATYEGVTSVDKGASFSATITIAEGYEIDSVGATVTMGGIGQTYTIVDNVITISIAAVTGNVVIKVPTVNINTGDNEEPDAGGDDNNGNTDSILFTISGEDLQTYVNSGISAAGEWHTQDDCTFALTDVTEYRGCDVTMTVGSNALVYCFLTAGRPSNGKVVSYATGYRAPVVVNGTSGQEVTVPIPNDAVYLYNYIGTEGDSNRPVSISIKNNSKPMETEVVDINSLELYTGGLKASGEWHATSGANCIIYDISAYRGGTLYLTSNDGTVIYAFLTDLNNMTVNKLPTYACGTGPFVIEKLTEDLVACIPANATYLYMYANSATVNYKPTAMRIEWR